MAVSRNQDPVGGRPPRRRLANAIRALAMDAVAGGQFRPSRHADGHGRHRRGAVERLPAPQPGQSALARPRPLRAVERPRLDAAVRAAAPDRLRPADRGAQALPPAGLADAPGHPERESTLGIETTTGPLGQGLRTRSAWRSRRSCSRATSTAPASRSSITTPMSSCGDGCLMEGISHEACSLAGTLEARQADRVLRRQRHLDRRRGARAGSPTTRRSASRRTAGTSCRDVDGHDPRRRSAPRSRRRARSKDRPSLICCKTIIGFGAPNKQGTEATHGAALGADEVAAARKTLGWEYPPFEIPDDIKRAWDARERGAKLADEWQQRFARYARAHTPISPPSSTRRMNGDLPKDWAATSPTTRSRKRRPQRSEHGDAQGVAGRARSVRSEAARVASAARPISPARTTRTSRLSTTLTADEPGRRLHPLRRARVRHGRDHERHRAARRLHSVRRHVPRVLRLRAQRAAHVRADAACARSTCSRTTPSASARTGRRISRSSTSRACALIPNMHLWRPCDAVETRSRGARRSSARTGRRCWRSRARTCRT